MIILGDENFSSEKLLKVQNIDDISNTPPNSTIYLASGNVLIQKFCKLNKVNYAVVILSIKEAIYANNLNAKYIICAKDIAASIQKIAENYMFDSKILVEIDSEDEIEWAALNGIDGVIYK